MSSQHAYYQKAFPVSEFRRRREQVCDVIGDAVAVIQGAPATGAMDRFRQHNDFYYLCGVETAHAYLTIDGGSRSSTLYLPRLDARAAQVDGPELNADQAEEAIGLTGVDDVKPLTALAAGLRTHATVYVCGRAAEGRQACQDSIRDAEKHIDGDPWFRQDRAECSFLETLRGRLGPIEFRDLSPVLGDLRRLKSPTETGVMRRAGELTAKAVCEAMRCTAPGLIEGQLAAVADYLFMLNGARGGGYRPIVAGGENIWHMHYFRNDAPLKDGDLVLMDYAPDYCNYTSDIGRMWPVGGRYAPWQRELYGFVVDYHLALLDLIRPGKTPRELRAEAAAEVGPAASKAHWSCPPFRVAVEKLLETSRACTHSVGMAVHDESGYQDDDVPLEPGLVFALDPQLWVPEDQLYIRTEDTVLVTESGVENLTHQAPHALDEIEALMREPGVLDLRPDLMLDPCSPESVS